MRDNLNLCIKIIVKWKGASEIENPLWCERRNTYARGVYMEQLSAFLNRVILGALYVSLKMFYMK